MSSTTARGLSRSYRGILAATVVLTVFSAGGTSVSAASADEVLARLQNLEREVADLKKENATILRENALLREHSANRGPRQESAQAASTPVGPRSATTIKPPSTGAPIPPATFAAAPVKAPPLSAPWTGVYVGLGLGTRSGVVDASVASAMRDTTNLLVPPGCAAFPCPGGEPLDNTAFRVSTYLGYNWQFAPQWLAGIEGDFGFASASRTLSGMYHPGGSAFFLTGSGDSTFSVKTGWDASIRARIGFLPAPTLLAYATAGPAWLHLEQTSNCPTSPFSFCGGGFIPVPPGPGVVFPTNGPASITDSTTRLGWTLGGGFEAMLGGNWIARGEYRYADFGTWSPTDVRTCISPGTGGCTLTAQTVTDSIHVRTHTATFGVAYKFGAGAESALAYAAAEPIFYKGPPAAAMTSWTGLHLGAGAGLRSAMIDGSVPNAFTSAGVFPARSWTGPPTCGAGTGTVCPGGEPLDNTAFRASVYLGYDWQFAPKWLAGLEGDWGWADASRSLSGAWYPGGSPNFFQGQGDTSFSVKTTWDASIRARLGYLIAPTKLIYVTGGPAWLHVEQTSTCPTSSPANFCGGGVVQPQLPLDNFRPASITDSTTRLGWTIGIGGEAAIWTNWIVRAEYRYADYGTWTNTDVRPCGFAPCAHGSLTVTDSLRLQTHTATLGLAYKFDWPR